LHRRGGPAFVYRIVSQPYAPGFTLAAGVDVANAPHGGVVAIPVTAVRRGYDGPITLAVEGIDGLKLSGQTIAEKKNDTNLLLTVPESLSPGSLAHLRITGTAKVGEQTLSAVARCSKALSASLAGLPYPPPSLGALVALGVGPAAADFFELSMEGDSIVWPQGASTVEAKVTLKRLDKFNDPVQVAVAGLPPGVTAQVEPIAAGQTSTKLTLTGPPQMPAGDYPLSVTGTGTFNLQPKRVELAAAKIRVVPPVELALEAPDHVAPGSGEKLKVTLARHAAGLGEVAVSWQELPAGVRINGPETIAADANSAQYTVQVESSVTVPSVVLRAVANAVVGERPVRCSSSVAVLRIESVQVARP
jgi:hypothetical protein